MKISLPSVLEKYILSFLVEGNSDLLFTKKGTLFEEFDFIKKGSSLSIIRSINQAGKNLTQDWQDQLNQIKKLVNEDPIFKKIFLKFLSSSDPEWFKKVFLPTNLMTPIFQRMFFAEPKQLIEMLKEVFRTCHEWQDCPEIKPQNVIEAAKLELRQCYIDLNRLQQTTSTSLATLGGLQWEFKFLLLEQILLLLFKNNKLHKNIETESLPLVSYHPETTVILHARRQRNMNKCLFLCCFIPLALTAMLTRTLMPEGYSRSAVFGTSLGFSILCLCVGLIGVCVERWELRGDAAVRRYRDQFLNRMDNLYDRTTFVTEQPTAPIELTEAVSSTEYKNMSSKSKNEKQETDKADYVIDVTDGMRAPLLSPRSLRSA